MDYTEHCTPSSARLRDDAWDVGAWLGATGAPSDVIAAQERVAAALERALAESRDPCGTRGRRVCGPALECSCGGIDAVPHATDHAPNCAIWGAQ